MVLAAIFTTIALYLQAGRITAVPGRGVLWAAFPVALYFLYDRAADIKDRATARGSVVLGVVFGTCMLLGAPIMRTYSLGLAFGSGPRIIASLVIWLGLSLLAAAIVAIALNAVLQAQWLAAHNQRRLFAGTPLTFAASAVAVFLAWIPYFVIYFPGLLSFDSVNQSRQALGLTPLDNHHPVLHTAAIALFERAGNGAGSLTWGVAAYTIAQMALLATSMGMVIWYLGRRGAKSWVLIALTAFFALLPTTAVLAVTMWKDVVYAAVVLAILILSWQLVRRPAPFLRNPIAIATFIVAGFGFCAIRNNGFYAFLLCIPVFLIVLRAHWRRLLPVLAVIVIAYGGYNWLIIGPVGAKSTDVNLALSLPLQQIARVVTVKESELTARERTELGLFLPVEEIPRVYQPWMANNVKNRLIVDAFHKDPEGFARLWLHLGRKYPAVYFEAFLDSNAGYWYPDINRWIVWNPAKDSVAKGGLEITAPGPARAQAQRDITAGLATAAQLPIVSLLFSIGFAMWLLAFGALVLIRKGRARMLCAMTPLAALWLSSLASPVWAEYRYLFGVILGAPVVLILAVISKADPKRGATISETSPNDTRRR